MNGTNFLLDTNIVLYLLDGDATLAELLNQKQLYLSIITEMELLSFTGLSEKEETTIQSFLSDCTLININPVIKTNEIRSRRQFGNKLPDSIIAATAGYLNIPLTSADKDFIKITDIALVCYEK